LDSLRSKIEVLAVVLEEAQEASTQVDRLVAVFEVVHDQANDGESAQTTGMHFVEPSHDEQLLH